MSACPLLLISWEKLKEIKLKFMLTFLERVELSPSLYIQYMLMLLHFHRCKVSENAVSKQFLAP